MMIVFYHSLLKIGKGPLLTGILIFSSVIPLIAQNYGVEIFSYTLNEVSNTLDLDVLVTKDGKPYELIKDDEFRVTESSDSHTSKLRVVHLSRLNVDNENLVGSTKPNYKLYLKPDRLLFKDSRSYLVQLFVDGKPEASDDETFKFVNERVLGDTSQFWNYLIGGALIVAVLLLGLSETVPWFKSAQFKKNYALRYGRCGYRTSGSYTLYLASPYKIKIGW